MAAERALVLREGWRSYQDLQAGEAGASWSFSVSSSGSTTAPTVRDDCYLL